ncbi:MAG: hypothetical protein QW057_07495 [Candidatus Bathyarchaeia archaeon]
MPPQEVGKDEAEAIVKRDLQQHYPDLTDLRFTSVSRTGRLRRKHWELEGRLTTKQYGGSRSFSYRLDASTGEIRGFEVR